jgi:hypothetical protein
MPFRILGGIWLPDGNSGGTITYRWIRSDGWVSAPRTDTVPQGETSHIVETKWDVDAATGTGQTQWVELEVSLPTT